MRAQRRPAPPAPPPDLEATVIRVGDEDVLVLQYAPSSRHPFLAALSDAEHSVAIFLIAGLSNAEIASVRGSSVRTVTTQVQAVYRRLGVGSRAELVARVTNVPL